MFPDKDVLDLQLSTTVNASSSAWSCEGRIRSNHITCCSPFHPPLLVSMLLQDVLPTLRFCSHLTKPFSSRGGKWRQLCSLPGIPLGSRALREQHGSGSGWQRVWGWDWRTASPGHPSCKGNAELLTSSRTREKDKLCAQRGGDQWVVLPKEGSAVPRSSPLRLCKAWRALQSRVETANIEDFLRGRSRRDEAVVFRRCSNYFKAKQNQSRKNDSRKPCKYLSRECLFCLLTNCFSHQLSQRYTAVALPDLKHCSCLYSCPHSLQGQL